MFQKKTKAQDDVFYQITSYLARIENESTPTIINKTAKIVGNVSFEFAETMGLIEGDVKANYIHIRPEGRIEGEIIADHVKISGYFKGSIKARVVTLTQGASIEAQIKYAYLIVSDGVILNGSCIFDETLKNNPETSILEAGFQTTK